jgi:UDP-N-acetylglucosamine acyltransferase
MVSKDVAPYCSAAGDRARLKGLNLVGLKRRGISARTIDDLKRAYRILFRSGLRTAEALDRVRSEVADSAEVRNMVAFVEKSRRGICR